MLEFIGIVVVCWIGFSIIKGIFRASSTVRSQEFGKEARHIATRELKVPDSYYSHLTINNIEAIKNSALILQNQEDAFRHCSWPRLLALVVYGEFHKDCQQWKLGNPITDQLFSRLGITNDQVVRELDRDASAVIYASV